MKNGYSWEHTELVIEELQRRGFWLRLTSPFFTSDTNRWAAGFTPHGSTGWNGRPDHEGFGDTPHEAIMEAAVLILRPESAGNEPRTEEALQPEPQRV